MPESSRSGIFLAACALMFAGISSAGTQLKQQLVVKGDVAGYAQSKLPLPGPVVIYVYASTGVLVAAIDARGGYDGEIMRRVEDAISGGDFRDFESAELPATSSSLREYLLDQGYRVEDVISKRTPYTLLLTVMDLDNPGCAGASQLTDRYVQALHRSVEKASAHIAYTIRSFKLSSPTVKIDCKK